MIVAELAIPRGNLRPDLMVSEIFSIETSLAAPRHD